MQTSGRHVGGAIHGTVPGAATEAGHCAAQSMLRASPGWPSMATRSPHAASPWPAFAPRVRGLTPIGAGCFYLARVESSDGSANICDNTSSTALLINCVL